MRTGAQCVIDGLQDQGIERLFGIPGGTVLDIFACLYHARFGFVLARHEQGAVHMADGYARATGRTGACIVTSGPGATNAVTGLATAHMDGIPLVCIAGQVPLNMIGNDAFQEADTTGITRSITKHNYLVRNVDDLPRIMREAFRLASEGKPGPVLIDIPKNIQRQQTAAVCNSGDAARGPKPLGDCSAAIAELADAVNRARKPLLFAGGGVIAGNAAAELLAVAHRAQAPVTTSLMGLGAFPETDPLSLRMLGMHGSVAANRAISECDLLVSVGARFDDRVTGKLDEFAPGAVIAHIDIDPSAISKSVRVQIPIVAHVKDALRRLLELLEPVPRKEWQEQFTAWQRENPDPDGCATCHGEGGVVFWEAEPDDPDYDYIQSTYDCGYNCSNCHGEDKPIEHTADYYHGLSERLEELATARSYEMEVVEVANAVAGESPRVTWRVHKDGEYQDLFSGRDGTYLFQGDPADFDDDAVRIGIGWGYNNSWVNDGIPPRKDTGAMGDPVQQVAHVDNTEPGGDETTAVTTFEQPLPEQARSGRDGFVILEMGPAEMDLNSRMANISLGSRSNTLDRDPGAKVDTESCLGCHNTIGRHGTYSDQDISSCISCHNAGSLSRDDSANQGTVDFMYIIHAIHGTGEKRAKFDRRRDHTVDGHYEGGYSYVPYPNTVLDCQACHTDDTHDFTEGYLDRMGVIGDKMKDRYLEGAGVNAPMASTCYSCHQDTEDDLADWELRFHLYHSGGDMYGNHDHAYYQENREKCLECHK